MAVQNFLEALEIEDDLEIHDHLSVAYVQKNELQKAFSELEVLSKAEPRNQEIWLRMARVAYMMEDYHTMDDLCQQALSVDENNPEAYCIYSPLVADVVLYYNKVFDVNPFCLPAYQERAMVKLDVGDREGADEDFLKYKELDEDNPTDISVEGIEQKVLQKYRDFDPYGIFTN